MPEKKIVIKFELRDLQTGYWVALEIPYTKNNWGWVLAHPNTAFIRKGPESRKPVATFRSRM